MVICVLKVYPLLKIDKIGPKDIEVKNKTSPLSTLIRLHAFFGSKSAVTPPVNTYVHFV